MRKLAEPSVQAIDAFDECINDISNAVSRQIYLDNRDHIVQAAQDFATATAATSWFALPRMAHGNAGAIVAGDLTKKHLTDLYTDHMVGAAGPSRKIYDDILVAAAGKCPFCGGVGQVYTLDHYLPKAYFPSYSVFPMNLVPCCRDCNSGKSGTFSLLIEHQTLHPYLDHTKYFDERWIFAEVEKTSPVSLRYVCHPPAEWSETERSRARQHFESYKFAVRYSVEAGAEIARIMDIRGGVLRSLSPDLFRRYLFENANCLGYDLNGWYRAMYFSLANTEWFYSADFLDPNWHLA